MRNSERLAPSTKPISRLRGFEFGLLPQKLRVIPSASNQPGVSPGERRLQDRKRSFEKSISVFPSTGCFIEQRQIIQSERDFHVVLAKKPFLDRKGLLKVTSRQKVLASRIIG